MEKQMFQTPKDYPHEFKIQAIKRFLQNGRRCKFTARKMNDLK
jgi:transposase-like protein